MSDMMISKTYADTKEGRKQMHRDIREYWDNCDSAFRTKDGEQDFPNYMTMQQELVRKGTPFEDIIGFNKAELEDGGYCCVVTINYLEPFFETE